MKRARRQTGASKGFLAMLGGLAFTGGMLALWHALPEDADKRKPASAEIKKPEAKKKSLEELAQETLDGNAKQRQSKEWIAVRSGKVEELFDEYGKHAGLSSIDREKRAQLLGALGKAFVPRPQWPAQMPGMNDSKLLKTLDFLDGVLNAPTRPGAEPTLALASQMEIIRLVPDFRAKVENSILKFYSRDARPGPRGDCFLALGDLGSEEGFELVAKAVDSSDNALNRAAVYALAKYAGKPRTEKRALSALSAAVAAKKPSWPLAVKILADRGSREVASVVPELLRKNASPIEIEVATFVVQKLKLKQYRELMLERLANEQDPYLRQNLDKALTDSQ